LATTTYLELPYPGVNDAPNGATQIASLAASTDGLLGGVVICTSSTRPTAREGAVAVETDTDRIIAYDGADWNVSGAIKSWAATPTLTATTTSPTLGTASVRDGYYTWLPGNMLLYHFAVKFGSSGTNAGSGQYLISLPFAAVGDVGNGMPEAAGSGLIRDNSASDVRQATWYIPDTNLNVVAGFASDAVINNSAPWAWAAYDYLAGTIVYHAVPT
jgi:hypothetical protein